MAAPHQLVQLVRYDSSWLFWQNCVGLPAALQGKAQLEAPSHGCKPRAHQSRPAVTKLLKPQSKQPPTSVHAGQHDMKPSSCWSGATEQRSSY
jgi:hypothetical protein